MATMVKEDSICTGHADQRLYAGVTNACKVHSLSIDQCRWREMYQQHTALKELTGEEL